MAKTIPNLAKRLNAPAPDAAEPTAQEEMDEFATSESLEKMLAESGAAYDQASVHVYLIEPESGDEPKIWRGSTDDYQLENLAKKFGSGKYRVKVYGPHPESGKHALLMNQIVSFRLTPEEDARIRALRDGKPMPGDAPAVTLESVRSIVADALRAAVPAQAPAQGLRELAEIVKIMMPMQTAAPVPVAPPPDPLAVIRTLAGVMRDIQPEREPLAEGVNAGPLDVILKLVDKFAPLYADAVKTQAAAALPGPAATPAAVSAAVPAQPSPEDQAVLRLKMGLAFLVEQAKDDNDPATYASVIVDNVPPADLAAMLAAPDWIERLAAFAPAVKEHAEWFGELKEEVQAEIAERAKANGKDLPGDAATH